jgi:tRNA(Ile)-lysidine synthase
MKKRSATDAPRLCGPSNALVQQVAAAVQRQRLFADGQRILVAVSGGLDSIVLVHILHHLARARRWRMVVAHFNHQLRGRSSDADERLVVLTAKQLRLPVVVGRGDVKAFAAEQKLSIEMAAREMRHRFLAQTARRRRMGVVALAHHAGDQAELFFVRLLRGAALEGIAGMRPLSVSPADKTVQLARPLLDIDRAALEAYVRDQKLSFREDATNRDTAFLRNRVRHDLIPSLKQYQPGVEQTISRLMQIARADSDLVGRLAQDWLERRSVPFHTLESAVQRRCIALQLVSLRVSPEFDLIERLRLAPGTTVIASGDNPLQLECETGTVTRAAVGQQAVFRLEQVRFSLDEPGSAQFGRLQFHWSFQPGNRLPARKPDNCEWFDADLVGPEILLRHWKPGDRFQPIGMSSPVKLQDFLTNMKKPRAVRVSLVITEDAAGQIFWVQGCRIPKCTKSLLPPAELCNGGGKLNPPNQIPPLGLRIDHGAWTTDHGPRTTDHGPRTTDQGLETRGPPDPTRPSSDANGVDHSSPLSTPVNGFFMIVFCAVWRKWIPF